MSITPEIEEKLWATSRVSRISEIAGFPLPSHAALKSAVAAGQMQLGIEYAAARDLVRISKSHSAATIILALTWVTPALAIGSIVVAFATGNWWALLGIISSFLGQTLANPYNPAKGLWKILVVAALLHLALVGSITAGLAWVSLCFAVSAIVLQALNRLAWKWAHQATLSSEAFAAHLFKTRNLHIRDSSGKFHDAL